MTLKRVVAVVTGGGAGIGQAIGFKLAREGASVVICDKNQLHLEQTARAMNKDGIGVLGLHCDVSDREQVDLFMDTVVKRYERINILVNNAGISRRNPISEPSHEIWHQILATNLNGVYYCTHRALQDMPAGGRIINISSISGKVGTAGSTAYCASKHAVIGFTRALALEVAPLKITVNAICPGWVETAMARADMEENARLQNLRYEEFREKVLAQIPLREIIHPEKVAELAFFLISPAGANITGQAIAISGGEVMY